MNSEKTYLKECEDNLGAPSVDSELSDIGLCSINKYEHMYNIMLCCAFTEDYKKALSLAKNITENSHADYSNKMHLINGLLNQALGFNSEAEKEFEAMKEQDPKTAKIFCTKTELPKIEIFPEQNRLCSYFGYVKLSIKNIRTIVSSI